MGKMLKVMDSMKENMTAKILREINKGKGCKVKKTHRK